MIKNHLSTFLKFSRVPSLIALTSTVLLAGVQPPIIEESFVPEPTGFAFGDLFTPTADLRLRYEFGDQDPLDESHAATLRARIGAKLNEWNGFTGLVELESTIVADSDSYRAASVDGPADHTIIADPESVEMNRLWLGYTFSDTTIKIGRQRIIHDNARFIGNVG